MISGIFYLLFAYGISMVVVLICSIFYPKPTDFNHNTIVIIWLSGLIMGIGIPLSFRKKEELYT